MTTLTVAAALVAILALTAWTLGGLLLRTLGASGVIAGLIYTAAGHPAGLAAASASALVWLAGHDLYALRHNTYKSPLARRIHTQLLPARLDPTRRWTTPASAERSPVPAPLRPRPRPRTRNPHA